MTTCESPGSIALRRVSKMWNGRRTLDDITRTFHSGSTTVVLGPSGAGKSTLLNIIAGYVVPDAGAATVNGGVAYLLQQSLLFDNLSAEHNVRVAAGASRPTLTDEDIVRSLGAVGLAGLAHNPVDQLSGGERQRVQFAGLLASRAEIILMDEPTSSLDRATGGELAALIEEAFVGRTVVIVSHDVDFVERIGGARILTLSDGRLS